MKHTIYLPAGLERRVREYLRRRRKTTLSSLVQEALTAYLEEREPARLLEIAGIVQSAKGPAARERAEDAVPIR
jgi:metal-responsive CopG/Arc/MetJ family transcriptional regulator